MRLLHPEQCISESAKQGTYFEVKTLIIVISSYLQSFFVGCLLRIQPSELPFRICFDMMSSQPSIEVPLMAVVSIASWITPTLEAAKTLSPPPPSAVGVRAPSPGSHPKSMSIRGTVMIPAPVSLGVLAEFSKSTFVLSTS